MVKKYVKQKGSSVEIEVNDSFEKKIIIKKLKKKTNKVIKNGSRRIF